MAYSKQTWDTTSYVNPTRMNHIEDGIEAVDTKTANDIDYASGTTIKSKIDSIQTTVDGLNATNIPLTNGDTRMISSKFAWTQFGSYYSGTTSADISSIWDDMNELLICVSGASGNAIWLNLIYGKGQGTGIFAVSQYYSTTSHAIEAISINATNKTVQLDSTWTKMVAGGNDVPITDHRFYIYWR